MTLKQQIAGLQEEVENYRQRTEEKDKKIKAAYEQVSLTLSYLMDSPVSLFGKLDIVLKYDSLNFGKVCK